MSNLLVSETSLYLRQHAANPVDWQPWGEAAFAEAKKRDCLILLSIGYSSCHWCHVMAHESFEDKATAEQMNQHFVNVKVDREERPDIDQIYQLAHQVICQRSGGWPLTLFLDPHSATPIFAGTYFPPDRRYQMPAFTEVLQAVAKTWDEKRGQLDEQSARLQKLFQDITRLSGAQQGNVPDAETMGDKMSRYLAGIYDSAYGGFGDAPKFPMVTSLQFLLKSDFLHRKRNSEAAQMITHTLTCMARGGIFDHIGGGFFRYSTDQQWMIPHFEKMLYDNGLLLALYAEATTFFSDLLFRTTLRLTADWMVREMQLPDGGYRASIDADSEGGEGAFYVWSRKEVSALLNEDEELLIETLFGLDKPANFEGLWCLRRTDAWGSVVERLSMERPVAEKTLNTALVKLAKARATRPAPTSDDKVICAWNGLAIKGMALASIRLDDPTYMESALRALDFIREHLWRDGYLCSIWDGNKAKPWGFLDDYACLLDALLMVMECHWRPQDAEFAKSLADSALNFFADDEQGGFFFTSHDHESLLSRLKPVTDDMVPAGNALMMDVLLRLGHLFAEPRYLTAASAVAQACVSFEEQIELSPRLVLALYALDDPQPTVVIQGPEADLQEWLQLSRSHPELHSYGVATELQTEPHQLPFCIVQAEPLEAGQVRAFMCKGLTCELPVTKLDDFRALLAD